MLYDTAIRLPKVYRHLLSRWTDDVLTWSGDTPVLLGIPAYDDAGVAYHYPEVENLDNALRGVHGGLSRFGELPANYAGIAIYCEWEMDAAEWACLREGFGKAP